MELFYVYMLKCSDNSYYVGHTENIERRIVEHKDGKIDGYTCARLPVELVYLEHFQTRDDAFVAERRIKGWSRKKKEALIQRDWKKIVELSNHNKSSNPSTSSGRAERELSVAFTPESIEGSGRAERELSAAFTAEPVEASERTTPSTSSGRAERGELIQTNVPLHDKNWFGTGGPAKHFAAPCTAQEFAHALQFANDNKLELFLLGEGANILISDDGFDGLVIKPNLKTIEIASKNDEAALVSVGAGVSMSDLIEFCLERNLIGLEEFSGIPGTVGGSVYINLHYFQFLLSQFLVKAEVIDKQTGALQTVDNTWFNFGYNTSRLHDGQHYLVNATFALRTATDLEIAYARGRRTEIIRHRAARYPQKNTCGSFFRNFHDDEMALEVNGKKMIYVAYYLDKIGVKGALRVGDAQVSHQHANMLINLGNATSTDLINLARTMQEMVKAEFGITPQPECRLIGFTNYPLIK